MEYKPEELKKVQAIEVEILQEILRVCNENNLTYWIYGGSLLGAIRHNGFIPWDDDIDIAMMRDDYEYFLSIAPKCLKPGYTLQHFSTDPNTPTYFAKIRKDGTKFVEEYARNMNIHQGIFIDIFPHDLVTENDTERAKYRRLAEILKQLYIAKSVKQTTITREKKKKVVRTIQRKALHSILKIVPKGILFSLYDQHLRKYNDTNARLVNTRGMKNNENPIDDIFPLKKHVFENIEVNIPNNTDKVLKRCYGDYMKLPAPENRVTHSPCCLEFE